MFILAAVTDWIDGYLARKLGVTTPLGEFLDPVADKLMVAIALILLVAHDQNPWIVVSAMVIVGREITVSALREWMAHLGARAKVKVSSLGKWKTILQMVGLSLMVYRSDLFGLPIYDIGVGLLVIAAVLTLWSMVSYLQVAWPELRKTTHLLTGRGSAARICGSRKFAFVSPSGCSSVGRARPCQGRGHEFEPRYPLQILA